MRTLILISLLSAATANAGELADLKAQTVKRGFKNKGAIVAVIYREAKRAGLDPSEMLSIATLESGLNPNAWRANKNDTVDVGLFQINSVNFAKCHDLDLNDVTQNVRCAARILKAHMRHAETDPMWMCRYHSKTPSRKAEYCRMIATLN